MDQFPKNLVKKVSYRENAILVEFNENMNIDLYIDKEHEFLNPINYAIENNNKLYAFPIRTPVSLIKLGISVRFILPEDFKICLNEASFLHIGYVTRKKIFYVQNSKKEIVNICHSFTLKNQIEIIDIKNGNIEIINSFTLKYIYNGSNQFDFLNKEDFYIIKNNKEYYLKKITFLNSKQFLLIFNNEIFNLNYSNILLKVRNNARSLDVYGFSILNNAYIYVIRCSNTFIKKLNFIKYLNNIAYFKVLFSNSLKSFIETEFKISLYNKHYKVCLKGTDLKRNLVYIYIENIILSNVLEDNFYISMNASYEDVKTLDIYGDKVFIKSPIKSTLFIYNKFEVIAKNYNMESAIIKIDFNEKVRYSSIITNSTFDENCIPWDGNKIIIPPNNLIINHGNEYDTITLNKNESFGRILVYSELKYKFTNKSLANIQNCYLYNIDNSIYIKFDEYESMDIFLVFIEKLKYIPNENIKNYKDDTILISYNQTTNILFKDINYIRPLDSVKENPFKGQIIEQDCMILIIEENKCDIYGEDLYTNINGNLKIVGVLNETDIILLQYLKINGNLWLCSKNSSYNLDKVICKNIIIK